MSTTTRTTRAATATRTILVRTREGASKIEGIPANAKITFGPVQPGRNGYGENVLRIYTSANNQLAVVTGVVDFRDTSLTVSTLKRKVKEQSRREAGPKGSKSEHEVEYEETWETEQL